MAVSLYNTLKRELSRLVSRRIYIVAMVLMPVAMSMFFVAMLNPGLPVKAPVAVVDRDNSVMSRGVRRYMQAMETVEIKDASMNFYDAMARLREGEVFGVFVIPENFERDALAGRNPVLSFYSNMTYYIPGTLSFKGFKTVAVSTSGSIVRTSLIAAGAGDGLVNAVLQPVVAQDHPLHNPWANYSIYLSNTFIPGVIALMAMLVTVFSICSEIKNRTSSQWLEVANGSLGVALLGKMLPHTISFAIVGIFAQSLLYGYCHFPLNCSLLTMVAAMLLLVIASQSFALTVCCVIPNLRLALSVVSLVGVLSFSIAGLSFPVESMYGSIAIFSHMVPLRHYVVIYMDQALNGIGLYYSRWHFAALLLFPAIAVAVFRRLKSRLLNPIYIP